MVVKGLTFCLCAIYHIHLMSELIERWPTNMYISRWDLGWLDKFTQAPDR